MGTVYDAPACYNGIMRRLVFSTPEGRYKYHVWMSCFWLLTMVVTLFFRWESFGVLAIMEVSLYANFATELGAIDASKASDQTERPEDASPGDTGQLRLPF